MNAVERWNAKYPVGTVVEVRKDSGEVIITKTRSVAWALADGYSVIQLEGISGCYALSRVTAVKNSQER